MSNHTPGPWEASHDIGANCVATITSGWVVVSIGADPNKFDAESDARLIAAAPAMLDTLKEILETGLPRNREKAEQVIAKAIGQTE